MSTRVTDSCDSTNNFDKLKRNDVIRFQETKDSQEINGKILSLAGKRNGKYDQWYNVRDLDTGHEASYDMGNVYSIRRMEEETILDNDNKTENTYVVNIPRYRHQERACKEAKEKELLSWDQYEVYAEVKDEGQTRIGTNWVLTEKVIDN